MHGPPAQGHQKEGIGDITGAGPGSLQGGQAHDAQSAGCQVPGIRDALQAGAAPALSHKVEASRGKLHGAAARAATGKLADKAAPEGLYDMLINLGVL